MSHKSAAWRKECSADEDYRHFQKANFYAHTFTQPMADCVPAPPLIATAQDYSWVPRDSDIQFNCQQHMVL